MLNFLYIAVSWVLLRWHDLFDALGMDPKGGLTWALSIIMLTVTARLVLFRFFVRQVHYQRKMQDMQPKIKKLQEKYKNDKATLQREMMELQRSEGFNPITGCLPMVLQIPIFIALLHVLRRLKPGAKALYTWSQPQTESVIHAKLFGAPLPGTFGFPLSPSSLSSAAQHIRELGGVPTTARIVAIILVLISATATFITQKAVSSAAPTPPEGQAATVQKLMRFLIPLSVLGSGFIFPLGVLLYWFTSNIWTMLQQFYILRFHPHTPAAAQSSKSADGESVVRASTPRPGQKPVNPRGKSAPAVARPTAPATAKSSAKQSSAQVPADEPEPTGGSAPAAKPGQAPRPGARPANKRAPSKKRR